MLRLPWASTARASLLRAATARSVVLPSAVARGALPCYQAIGRPFSLSSVGRSPALARKPVVVEDDVAEDIEDASHLAPIEAPTLYSSVRPLLDPALYKAVTVRPFSYASMTPVQGEVLSLLPEGLAGPANEQGAKDLLVRAKTGTGKTLAFLLPAIQGRIAQLEAFAALEEVKALPSARAREARVAELARDSVGALILSPTRELASQIAKEAQALVTHLRPEMGVHLFVGGESRSMQIRGWNRSPMGGRGGGRDIVIATPGRIKDLIDSERSVSAPLGACRLLVLDEADTLLDMGFADELAAVNEHLPSSTERQTFLFSATVSPSIRKIARSSLKKEHTYIDTVGAEDSGTHAHIPQFVTSLSSPSKQVEHVLNLLAEDALLHPKGKAVVFLPTTRMTELFALLLRGARAHLPDGRGTGVFDIHSQKTQQARTRAAGEFRLYSRGYSVLVTSDVSARGVDYPGVTRVVQVGIPSSKEMYIHRVGRTGRAGKQGRGDLVLLDWERGYARNVLGDLELKGMKEQEVETSLKELVEKNDEALAARAGGSTKRRVSERDLPYADRISTLSSSLSTSLLPTVDEAAIKETFSSLLGYYVPRAGELGVGKMDVVEGLQEWATDGMGLTEKPFVGSAFLARLGVRANGGGGGARRSGGSRGGDRDGRDGGRQSSYGGGDRRPARSSSFSGGSGSSRDRPSFGASRSSDRPSRSFDRNDDRPRRSSSAPARSFDRRDRDDGPFAGFASKRKSGGSSGGDRPWSGRGRQGSRSR